MTIICVDDDRDVLEKTVRMCRALPCSPLAEGFIHPADTLVWLKNNKADIAILDINMPDIDGITLAVRLTGLDPGISIIFLTGYDKYALDAYRVHPSGYILKPLTAERLESEINYAMSKKRPESVPPRPSVEVRTFGEFVLLANGRTVRFARSQSKEALAFLIDKRGGSVTRSELYAAVRDNQPYDRAGQKYIDTIIRSMRDTLREYGVSDIMEMSGGKLRVRPELIDCDLFRFFSGDREAVSSFKGEYMYSYNWARQTEAYMQNFAGVFRSKTET